MTQAIVSAGSFLLLLTSVVFAGVGGVSSSEGDHKTTAWTFGVSFLAALGSNLLAFYAGSLT